MNEPAAPDPRSMSLDAWLALHPGTRTGTFTIDGVKYTSIAEVRWRTAVGQWPRRR